MLVALAGIPVRAVRVLLVLCGAVVFVLGGRRVSAGYRAGPHMIRAQWATRPLLMETIHSHRGILLSRVVSSRIYHIEKGK